MKKLFVAMACVAALAGCNDSVSGKYEGTWERPGLTFKIESKGDHYTVERQMASTGKASFEAKEDADGYLTFTKSGKRFLKWQDANTVTNATGSDPLQKK
ncbi:hypothetical protein Q5N60_16815 [Vibrio cholerae]|uniref:hypothetical protein n=1 Tax=Vibrio cholerae TaxID=666 RepID=UPI00293469F1|nr:hypothetical protein [Vibrio cholerae]MDV2387325.1 hypothetical protein [Vibrio cholerae]